MPKMILTPKKKGKMILTAKPKLQLKAKPAPIKTKAKLNRIA